MGGSEIVCIAPFCADRALTRARSAEGDMERGVFAKPAVAWNTTLPEVMERHRQETLR